MPPTSGNGVDHNGFFIPEAAWGYPGKLKHDHGKPNHLSQMHLQFQKVRWFSSDRHVSALGKPIAPSPVELGGDNKSKELLHGLLKIRGEINKSRLVSQFW